MTPRETFDVTLGVFFFFFCLLVGGVGFIYLCCRSCSPSLSCVSSTWARRGLQTGLGGQELCMSLCCRHTQAVESDSRLRLRTSLLFQSCPGSWLPSSSFAFLIRNGDVEALVVDVDQRPEGANRGPDQSCLDCRDCDSKKQTNPGVTYL